MGYGARHSILVPMVRGMSRAGLRIGSHLVATTTPPGSTSACPSAVARARSDAPLP